MTDPLFIPKGLMCCVCEHAHRKCNHLDFTKMPVIQKHKDGYKEVKCIEFERREEDE